MLDESGDLTVTERNDKPILTERNLSDEAVGAAAEAVGDFAFSTWRSTVPHLPIPAPLPSRASSADFHACVKFSEDKKTILNILYLVSNIDFVYFKVERFPSTQLFSYFILHVIPYIFRSYDHLHVDIYTSEITTDNGSVVFGR
jgi:hypothetical protein